MQLGRKVGKKCKKQTRKNRRKRVCKYYVPAGTLSASNDGGVNSISFSGKINDKPLKFGLYRVTAVAIDAAGNRARRPATTFPVLR